MKTGKESINISDVGLEFNVNNIHFIAVVYLLLDDASLEN